MRDESDVIDRHAHGPLERWEELVSEQTSLFKDTAFENETLQARVTELERELAVWKLAYNDTSQDKDKLKKEVIRLERSIGAWKEDTPMIFVLIDGDGNIFHPELIAMGQAGGRKAAARLTQGIYEYMDSLALYQHDNTNNVNSNGAHHLPNTGSGSGINHSAGRPHIYISVYCNAMGLRDVLVKNLNICDEETFHMFCVGFNQAAPMISFVDAGAGKEAADSKIKECLRVFSRFPQTIKVFFGGSHDNGYTSTLISLENEGLLHKTVLLMGYKDLAAEIRSLNLPYHEIPGLFLQSKIPNPRGPYKQNYNQTYNVNSNVNSANNGSNSKNAVNGSNSNTNNPYNAGGAQKHQYQQTQQQHKPRQPSVSEDGRSSTSTGKSTVNTSPSPMSKPKRVINPNLSILRHKPPPCNWHYLDPRGCEHGSKCRFAHDYVLTDVHFAELIENGKKTPCPAMNRGGKCNNAGCPFAHVCPRGAKCKFYLQDSCKFSADGMHQDSSTISHSKKRAKNSSAAQSSIGTSSPSISNLTVDEDEDNYDAVPSRSPQKLLDYSFGMPPSSSRSQGVYDFLMTSTISVPEVGERERRSY